ncbi:MAG: acyl-CoA dehydrogenase family protein, partial [Chloroflexi bacterium]|nr:acyl-CoA dehydrogenase family protein [Chloroflexota bacterium]
RGYTDDLWNGMANQGWMGLITAEELGGAGLNFLDLCVLLEEFGRALVPGPFINTVLSSGLVEAVGTDAQKQQYCTAVAAGQHVMTLALTEPSARFDSSGVEATCAPDGDGYVLNGTKLFIPDAHVSDTIVVVARAAGSEGDEGVSMFLVPGNAEGLSTTVLQTIAADKQCEVTLNNVRVGADALLGPEGGAWPIIEIAKRYYTVAYCAYMVGLAQRDFEISVDYAKERIQFGRPIGSFQAIQHKAADMITDVDGSRFIMYRAAWAVTEGEDDADLQVAMAKAWCSDATRRVVAHGQQIHGGIGFTKEYIIQLYFRRQKMAELMWGDADHHREKVAELLGI